jgi:Regulator of chromosome condensation (RCC1) repeat/Putative Ig domain
MPAGADLRARTIARSRAALMLALVLLLAAALSGASARAAGTSSAGEVLAFGGNGWGQLGSTLDIGLQGGQQLATPTPTPVALPGAGGSITQLAAGAGFSLALTSSGQLYAFGENQYGQLGSTRGNGSEAANPTPSLVQLPTGSGPAVQVAAGAEHSLVLTASGRLYAFGDNRYGQLGNATNAGIDAANPQPALVSLPPGSGPIAQIAAGAEHSLVLSASGRLYAFGANDAGQLGVATGSGTEAADPAPTQVVLPASSAQPVAVAAGMQHSLVLSASGQIYAFGSNRYGQLGRQANAETANANPAPLEVALPAAAGGASEIAAGGSHSLVLSASGLLYAFGSNTAGQLGSGAGAGSEAANPLPRLAGLPAGEAPPIAIAAGASDSLVLTTTGGLLAFGSNRFGALGSATGSGSSMPNDQPRAMEAPPGTTIDAVASGSSATHTLALVADLAVLDSSLPSGQLAAYSAAALAEGGAGGYTWSASGLPAGLQIDSSDGQIAGTPSTAGTSQVVLHVRDGFGVSASSAALALSVAGPTTAPRAFISSTLTEAELRASLRQQLGIKGTTARIASLRKRRSFTSGFTALTAGRLAIDWYYVPAGAHLARAVPTLLASGAQSFAHAGTRTITLKLTLAGRRLLRKRARIALVAKGSFTPSGGHAVTARVSFVLKH